VCAVAAQPGHTKELQSIQLERGLRIVDSPGVIFDDYDHIQGQKESSVLLRNVVKPEDVDDPISVGRCAPIRAPLCCLNLILRLPPVEEILARTQTEKLMKIYNLPTFSSTLEFLTMLALSTGRLLKGGTPDILSAARQVLIDWNHQKVPFFSEPPELHASHIPSTIPGRGGQVATGAETTGQAQIVSAFGAPFTLEGLFGEADAEAMDAEPDSGSAADNVGMDVEDDAGSGFADGGMIVDDDNNNSTGTPYVLHPFLFPHFSPLQTVKNVDGVGGRRHRPSSRSDRPTTASLRKRKRARSPSAPGSGPSDHAGPGVDAEFDSDVSRAPKRLRPIAVRTASLPTAAVALRSRRGERLARRKREKALRKAAGGVGGMQVDR